MFDGKPQQLQVKQKFPKGEPLFVLVSLKKKQAKIAVAGGSFDDGNNVTLTLGKKLTLLDTATGVRYELEARIHRLGTRTDRGLLDEVRSAGGPFRRLIDGVGHPDHHHPVIAQVDHVASR